MRDDLARNIIIFGIIIVVAVMSTGPSTGRILGERNISAAVRADGIEYVDYSAHEGIEYWALLVAVGVYANHPNENRPSMLEEVENMYNMLLGSERWKTDHIKFIKGKNATAINIIKSLRWLDRMDDKDDISLVYITTHGFPLSLSWGGHVIPLDIPPFDEEDGCDEALVTYWGFEYPLAIIWDDELNLLLSLLDSKGVCLIVDSCYSGGFNDPPYWNKIRTGRNIAPRSKDDRKIFSPSAWMEGFAEDLSGKGRVVLMSCQEDEVSYGSYFSHYLIEGLIGFADVNMDGVVSAEEAFNYAESRGSWQHPTIYDGYPGELPLTEVIT